MKNEFVLAFNEVLEEKQLPREIILKALESALVSAYRRSVNASNAQHVEATVDLDTGKVTIFAEKEVVDSVQDVRTEVTVADARKVNPEAEPGMMVVVESTPRDFGRVAAQTARQVIQQRIREAERQAQLSHYEKQVGEIVNGVVQAVNGQGITIGLDMKAEGTMLRKEMIPGERFKVHDRVRALVHEAKDGPRGPQIFLSRAHRNFLRRLLENEVPEIYHGVVEIRSIAREPGERAKVAVAATQQGIDPVGACVGIRGVRIQAIVRELHEEKIDVIEWNADPVVYIAKAISPARVSGVYLNETAAGGKTATVVVPEDQLSLAIGRDGQNARLAAKLTTWRIDIKSISEAASDVLDRLRSEPALEGLAAAEANTIAQIEALLLKKSEGRSLLVEEYDQMNRFVDRIEKRTASKRQAEPEVTRGGDDRQAVKPEAFDISLLDSKLPEHVANILQEAGYITIGELVLQMKRNPDVILALQGMGPKAMAQVSLLVEEYSMAAPVVEPVKETLEVEAPAVVEQPVGPVVEEAVVEGEKPVEPQPVEMVEPAPVVEETEEESRQIFDELFTLRVEPQAVAADDEDEDESGSKPSTGKKKKKKKSVEITYDPDSDSTLVRRKHKRGDDNWTEDW
ncbi:MAG TPA: transcription termination factor NusA [Anaerolineaceae bacterium]|nr:transcription termination factor NusA [Anaerolineaceae bacterium]HPN54085.1 transcription termination factor NusA [Anaerolineaceae bacterium]